MALSLLYGTSGDVREELGSPAEIEYSAGDIEDARAKATNTVNIYVAKAYPDKVPFVISTLPEALNEITNDLAVYYAKRRKHPGPAPLSEEVKEEYYEKSIKLLELIRDGDIVLPELADTSGGDVSALRSAYTPIFDLDDAENQGIDPDLTNHIADERS